MDIKVSVELRVTIQDDEQSVSFLANRDLASRLIAGCSVNPRNLEELLLAAEVYQQGISAWLMSELMEFDKAWQRQGKEFLQHAFASAGTDSASRPAVFQVVDELTRAVAYEPWDGGLIMFDLGEHRILVSGNLDIPREGQVLILIGGRPTKQAVTYILPKRWLIETLSYENELPER